MQKKCCLTKPTSYYNPMNVCLACPRHVYILCRVNLHAYQQLLIDSENNLYYMYTCLSWRSQVVPKYFDCVLYNPSPEVRFVDLKVKIYSRTGSAILCNILLFNARCVGVVFFFFFLLLLFSLDVSPQSMQAFIRSSHAVSASYGWAYSA